MELFVTVHGSTAEGSGSFRRCDPKPAGETCEVTSAADGTPLVERTRVSNSTGRWNRRVYIRSVMAVRRTEIVVAYVTIHRRSGPPPLAVTGATLRDIVTDPLVSLRRPKVTS